MTDGFVPIDIATKNLPNYFKNVNAEDIDTETESEEDSADASEDEWHNSICCKNITWVEDWLINIGATIG